MGEDMKSAIRLLKDKLAFEGYTEGTITEFDVDLRTATFFGEIPLWEYKFRDNSPLSLLVRLFLLGVKVKETLLKEIFASEEIKELTRMDILKISHENEITSQIKIFPFNKYIFICDFNKPDHVEEPVYSPGIESTILTEAMIKQSCNTVLDLGTGTGILAILASEYSKRVVGVDVNPRAVYFAKLNLFLNGIDNVEFRLGSLYDSVNSESFDQITASLPFEICSSTAKVYRDGGEYGDKILKDLLSGIKKHLSKNGYCQIITRLSEFEGFSHEGYIRKFARENNFDTLLLLNSGCDPYSLARGVNRGALRDYEKYRKKIFDYLDHLQKIELIKTHVGVITFKNNGSYRFEKQPGLKKNVTFHLNPSKQIEKYYMLK